MFVLLTVVDFIFMATESAFVDAPSCISMIVEMHPNVLVDLLVVLVRVFDMVAPCPPGGVVHLRDAGQQNDFGWGSD